MKTGTTVAENGAAAAAIISHSLTLDQAATLIEFDGDHETVNGLTGIATTRPDQFAHAAQRARDDRRVAQIKADTSAELIARGYDVLDREPGYSDNTPVSIRDLVTADGERVTPDDIAEVEGRAAYVRVYLASDEANISYYLHNPKAGGFRKHSGTGSSGGPMSDQQKAERKNLIASNKAWASAEVVRREWLAESLRRKTLPKDTVTVIGHGLTTHRHERQDRPSPTHCSASQPAATGKETNSPR